MPRAKGTTEVPTDKLDAMLVRLQLSGIRDQLDSLLDEAARANLSARETLALLCEREITRKDHRRIEMALKLAHFPAMKAARVVRRENGSAHTRDNHMKCRQIFLHKILAQSILYSKR